MDEFSPAHPRLLQSTAPIQPARVRFESENRTVQESPRTTRFWLGILVSEFEDVEVTTHCLSSVGGRKATYLRYKEGSKKLTGYLFWDTKAPSYSILRVFGMDLEVELDYWTACGRSYLQFPSCFSFHFLDKDINNEDIPREHPSSLIFIPPCILYTRPITPYLQCKSRLDSSLFPENYDCLQWCRPASSSFDSLDGSPRIISGSIMVQYSPKEKLRKTQLHSWSFHITTTPTSTYKPLHFTPRPALFPLPQRPTPSYARFSLEWTPN
jgi:hypothetical protein